MRPSHPVRHRCPLRNRRFFCSCLRLALFIPWLGMQARLTPFFCRSLVLTGIEPSSSRDQTRDASGYPARCWFLADKKWKKLDDPLGSGSLHSTGNAPSSRGHAKEPGAEES